MKLIEITLNRIMVLKGGSPAKHKLGNIGRSEDDYIRVYAEDEDNYIGVFEEGFGFMDVVFNKTDCRPIDKYDHMFLNRQFCAIGNNVLHGISVDVDGNVVSSEEA